MIYSFHCICLPRNDEEQDAFHHLSPRHASAHHCFSHLVSRSASYSPRSPQLYFFQLTMSPPSLFSSTALAHTTTNSAPCTSTLFVEPSLGVGPTSTAYPSTFTTTESVDCGGCATLAIVSGHILAVGLSTFTSHDSTNGAKADMNLQPITYTTTMFETTAVTTAELVCSISAEVGNRGFHCEGGRCIFTGRYGAQ